MSNFQDMSPRELVVRLALHFVGMPYKWAGNDPMEGFDCSGLVVELLQSTGRLGRSEDLTAEMLRTRFKESPDILPGTLFFWDWNKDGKADHVEMVINTYQTGEIITVGASGGNEQTTNEEIAKNQNAFVKVREAYPGHFAQCDPFA